MRFTSLPPGGIEGGKTSTPVEQSKQLTQRVRELRRNQTEAEKILWMKLRNRQVNGVKFRRQQPIGPFIVDFVSLEKKLVIEVDGGQHNLSPTINSDQNRTAYLEEQGFEVLRFWNNDVMKNIESVLERISEILE